MACLPPRTACTRLQVASGNEIRSVCMAGDRHDRFPMGIIDDTNTWKVSTRPGDIDTA